MFESLAAQLKKVGEQIKGNDSMVILESAQWSEIMDAKAALIVELELVGQTGLAQRVDDPFNELSRLLNNADDQSSPLPVRNAIRRVTSMLCAIHRVRGRLFNDRSDSFSPVHKEDLPSSSVEAARPQHLDPIQQSNALGDKSSHAASEPQRKQDKTAQGRSDAGHTGFIPTPAMMNILTALSEAKTTIIQVDIEQASGYPIKTVKSLMPELETLGFVHRPHGKRRGYSITDKGRELLIREGQAGG